MSGNSYGLLRSSFFPSEQSQTQRTKPPASTAEPADGDDGVVTCGASAGGDDGLATFDQMDSVFEEIETLLRQNNRKVTTSGHSYSATSVMTYVKDGQGAPKVYQATIATRVAPGGVREIRKATRDSVSGLEKISVDRQLGERAHVEAKTHNKFTGDREEQTEFVNMDEDDTEDFEEEWKRILQPPLSASPAGETSEHYDPHASIDLNLPSLERSSGSLVDGSQPTTSAQETILP